jgi:hypothetical protein
MNNIVTFDMGELDLNVRATLIAHVVALGCTVCESQLFREDIPTLVPFNIPDGSTIISAREGFTLSKSCKKNLTEENYGTEPSKGLFAGGFLDMGGRMFTAEDAIKAIKELSVQTGRNFRPANPIEGLMFVRQYPAICNYFLILGKIWDGKVLQWWSGHEKFHTSAKSARYPSYFEVLIVEDR